ncbi:MAG: FkbM family methyltransferase [Candidatus Cyclobacteriaceae bacterium M3_2C_046]
MINRFILRKQFLTGYSKKFQLKIQFKTEDGGGRQIYKRSTYEDEISTFLVDHLQLQPGDRFFDVGANVGWYSLLIKKHFPQIHITAFEPDPVNVSCFKKNLVLNHLHDIQLEQKAVSHKNGKQQMYLYKNSNKGRNSMLPIHDYGTIEVETTLIDNYLEQNAFLRAMKMDIEGFEYFALLGAANTLKQVEVLVMEFAPGYMKRGNVDAAQMLDLLEKHQFSYHILKEGRLMPVSRDWLMEQHKNINLFLLKPDQSLLKTELIRH